MRILDLTHTIREDMQVFPGTEQPRLERGNTIERDGFCETVLSMYSHTGTHMDAPAHMIAGGALLNDMPVERFMGTAAVIPCNGRITTAELESCRDIVYRADFLLFFTGQDRLWGKPEYLMQPVPDMQVIRYAIESGKKGIGIDCMSVDPIEGGMPNHMALLGAGLVIVENLCRLGQAAGRLVRFAALPLKYADADGAPVRAVAMMGEDQLSSCPER